MYKYACIMYHLLYTNVHNVVNNVIKSVTVSLQITEKEGENRALEASQKMYNTTTVQHQEKGMFI